MTKKSLQIKDEFVKKRLWRLLQKGYLEQTFRFFSTFFEQNLYFIYPLFYTLDQMFCPNLVNHFTKKSTLVQSYFLQD